VYRDQAACTAHGDTEWVQESIPKYLNLIEGMPQLVQYVSPGQEPVSAQLSDYT
jgi:quinol monooxygenase YgiN